MKDNWEHIPLGELVTILKGKISEQSEYPIDGFIPIINTDALRGDIKVWGKVKGSIICDEANVLILWDGERSGLCAIGHNGVVGSTFAKMNVSNELNPEYLYRFIDFNFDWIQGQRTGTGVPHVPKDLKTILKIDFPPLPQQQKIAKILSTCDDVIEKTESAIAKYQALKQGMMHDLFTRGILTEGIKYKNKNGMVVERSRNQLRPTYQDAPELYKPSELGMIPKDWELAELEKITNYVDYRGKTPPKSDKGIFLVTAKNIKFGYIDYETSKEYIPNSAYKAAMSRGIPEIGDVLIATEAPLGNIAQIDIEGLALAQRVIKYRCHPNEMLNDFLKHSLMTEYFQKELEAESTGSTVKGIKGSRLHKLQVYKPKVDEQNRIVQSLKPLESKIQTEQQSLAKYQQLKAGLMQDLLTGTVEVKV